MAIKAQVRGLDKVSRNLRQLGRKDGPNALGAGQYEANVEMMIDAKRNTPVLKGTLRGSGYVTKPVKKSRGQVSEAGFGGKADAYAVDVHERTEIAHSTGGAKYLERAAQSNRRTALRVIAREGGRALDKRRGAKQRSGIPVDPRRGAA